MFWRAIVFFLLFYCDFFAWSQRHSLPRAGGRCRIQNYRLNTWNGIQFCLLLLLHCEGHSKLHQKLLLNHVTLLRMLYQFTFRNWHIDPSNQILCFYVLTQNLPTSGLWTGMFTLLLPSALRGIYCTCIRHPQVLLWTQDTIFSNLLASLPS